MVFLCVCVVCCVLPMQLRRREVSCDPKSATKKSRRRAPHPRRRSSGEEGRLPHNRASWSQGARGPQERRPSRAPRLVQSLLKEKAIDEMLQSRREFVAQAGSNRVIEAIPTVMPFLPHPNSVRQRSHLRALLPRPGVNEAYQGAFHAAEGPTASPREGWERGDATCKGPAVLPQSDAPGGRGKVRWCSPPSSAWHHGPRNRDIAIPEAYGPGLAP